ncbi:TVP38/TMEM64 family protein [Sinorhizobium numidicum]|uniref:TVP38/TMEM64 family membrane protein n=1 Tax=Sinorhizobium numidicum TaxID=680248 RepID=A0ABY8D4K6_9HYPH|nr:TVP38/TMEM64 family protein [Sinorhizobium numidicum]WEX77831.1 TVP38/TMEM64 family protein [Sinorhizobium numidicum]WEX84490.1 TVP38/TMEM64 family protein [Sinorhizobium numidicum]
MSHGVSNRAGDKALKPSGRKPPEPGMRPSPWRFVPFALLVMGGAACYALGLQDYVSLSALVNHREALSAYVDTHPFRSGAAFFAVYVAIVVFSIPAASVLTIFSGFLFGCILGGVIAVFAATLGSSLLFVAARGVLSDLLRRLAGPSLERLADGFRRNAFLYLLILRLAPIFPFFIVNIAPAFFDVKLRTFVVATLIGIVPATFAYAWLGRGLDEVIARAAATGGELSLSDFATADISLALVALALIAALPLAFRIVQSRRKRA